MRKYELTINDKSFTITVKNFTTESAELEVNGKPYQVRVDQIVSEAGGPQPVRRAAAPQPVAVTAPKPAAVTTGGVGSVTAPIPGLILEIFVKPGESVEAGQPVLKMEAMKMENVISAPIAGRVSEVKVSTGETVNQGQELVIIG